VGIRGEICVAGIGVGKGYWQDPGKTAQSFIPNPYLEEIGNMDFATLYKTGDIGYFREDGTVECLGRLDDQVKIRGNRIELGEIEQQLLSHQEIKEAVVLAKVSEDNNKYLCAYLVGTQEAPTDTELREFLAGKLPAYMIPAYFVFIDKIPLTSNGKIDRKALPEPEAPVKEEKYEPPRNEKEQRLVEVWQKVLGLAKIGITDNFFEIGGDSINAIQVAAQLKQYQLELRINHLFLYPNIKELANWVTTAVREIPQDLVEGKVTLTPIQQWFFAGNFTDSHHYNLALMLYNPQGFPPTLLEKLFTKIIEHHDALRMVYVYEKKANRVIQENRNLEGKLFDLEILSFEHTDSTNPELGKEIEKEATRIQASIDLEKGPLVKLGLFKTSAGDHLLIAIHHLVVDGISWRILLEDITTGYHQLLQGKDITFPAKTDSFKYWAEKLEEFAAGTPGSGGYNVLKELAFWENIQNTKIKPLPRDHHIGKEKKKHRYIQSLSINLEEKETEMLLREVNWAYNTEINDILLTTLGLAIKEWSGNDKVLINLEGHGRENIIEPVDISRTVGWFTTEYPVILDMGKSQQLSYQIKYVKETLRSIPNKGIGYGILRYLTPAEKKPGVSMTLEPEIGFNYLGQFGSSQQSDKPPQNQEQDTTQSIQMSHFSEGQSLGPDMEENYAININGMLMGKRLNISFSFNKYEYETQSIEKLCSAYKANLLQIIDHCTKKEKKESTPSDFDYSDLDLEELEELKNGLSQVV